MGETGMKHTDYISAAARLIDRDESKIQGGEMLYGFVAGLMASNSDTTDIYTDGILKVLDHDINRLGVVLDEMAAIAGDSVRVTVTVSADEAMLPHNVKKYLYGRIAPQKLNRPLAVSPPRSGAGLNPGALL